jgi:hypothetical protein
MRMIALAAFLAVGAAPGSAQVLHPGEVEHWFLALKPLHEARSCITDEDPLRPGLDVLFRDTHARAMREIRSDYEKGVLTGRLAALPISGSFGSEDACQGILAAVARGLLRLHVP